MGVAANSTSSVLLADIGGTTSRLAVAGALGRPERIATMANNGLNGPAAAISRYLKKTGARPEAGVIAVAAPVGGEEITLTNRGWTFRVPEIAAQFKFSALHALNDFEAVAWALPGLTADDVRALGPKRAAGSGVRVVCGPGTGLGVAALIPDRKSWRVVASEGGHMSFGAVHEDEEAVFRRLRESASAGSAEAILSGSGLARLHRAVNPKAAPVSPEEIIARAKAGDAAARATVMLFVRLLGRFAGDIALLFKASAVYLTGGVACGLDTLLESAEFRRGFEAHPPYQGLLASVPTFLITEPEPGLLGCAVYAERMLAPERPTPARARSGRAPRMRSSGGAPTRPRNSRTRPA
jgi:glucokinase